MTPEAKAQATGPAVRRGAAAALAAVIFLAIVAGATGNFVVDVLIQGAADVAVLGLWLAAGWGFGTAASRSLGLRGIGFQSMGPYPGHSRSEKTPAASATSSTVEEAADAAGLIRPGTADRRGYAAHGLEAHATADGSGWFDITAVALGLGVISLLTLGLGLAGLLNRPTAWAVLAVGTALAIFAHRHGSFAAVGAWFKARSPGAAVAWTLAVPLAVAFVAASLCPGYLWKPLDPHPYDVLSYHLQIPREWYDAGRIIPLRHNAFSFFPMGMETHDLLAMHLLGGPWRGMYLCQFMSLAHGGLTVLGVIAVLRSLGVGPVVSRLAGLMTAGVPWVLMLSSVCYVEPGVMLYTLLAAAWAMRAVRSPMIPPMVLAGVFAGLACGMKYTAFAMTAAPLLAVWPGVATRGNGWRKVVLPWLAGGVACVVVVSPWLVRNVIWAGNPVFPLAAGLFGPGHFTDDEVDRYRLAHQPPAAERSLPARLHAGFDRVIADWQFGYGLVPLTLLAGPFVVRSRETILLASLIAAMTIVWLLATHVMPRFLTPAIPLAAVLIGLAVHRLRWRPAVIVGGVAMTVQAGIGIVFTWQTLAVTLPLGRQGLFRLNDLTFVETDDFKAARVSGDRIALIGDAQAFFAVVPSDRLLYRSVFDVNVPPGVSTADAWLGKSIDQLRAEGCWVVVNTGELDRLTRTYAHLPRPGPPWDAVSPLPTVLPPTK